jgi:CO dehydrogenase/acetyl-CoA synthase epsilon subunit
MKLTISSKWLNSEANRIESNAKDNLSTWIVLGMTDKYNMNLDIASMYRKASQIKSIAMRREYLSNNGLI